MIVEDHEDTRAMIRAVLLHHGFEVAEVETAEHMFERLHIVNPDLIVLDIRLPGMDGCEALEALRAEGFEKPVFMFSEYYDLFSEQIGRCRPDGFFPKSKGPVPLVEAIKARLAAQPNRNIGGEAAT
jgi:CheY-like chemotaxis protein